MIVNDQRPATFVATSLLTLLLLGVAANAAEPAQPAPAALAPITVTFVQDGVSATYATRAQTIGAFLDEQAIRVADDDYLSSARDQAIADGMTIEHRRAIPVTLFVGSERRALRSAARTVAELLSVQDVKLGADDEVYPAIDAPLQAHELVRVVRVSVWTRRVRIAIAPPIHRHVDLGLDEGVVRTVDRGTPGERESVVRFVKRGGERPVRVVLASRILREPRAKLILQGVGDFAALAQYAKAGLEGTTRIAGSAMRMMASAYSAACYGCSGITAIGVPAGHGVVAVDPSIIPLGTKLFITGYGRAVAGDTGGAINGRRIDLGFNSEGAALRFGVRPVTVYVLK